MFKCSHEKPAALPEAFSVWRLLNILQNMRSTFTCPPRLETSKIRTSKMSKLLQVALDVWRQIIIIIVIIVLTGFFLVLLSLLVPSLILRLPVGIIARIFRPDLAGFVYGRRILMGTESIYKKPELTILLHFVLDGSLPAGKLRLAFEQKFLNPCDKSDNLKYSRLKQTWTQFLGFYLWKWDKDFSLNHHIRYYDCRDKNLVLPGICTEKDLQRVTPDLISMPFKEGTSPWEMLVIPNYRAANNSTGKRQSVIVFRVHHALADGYSILQLMFKLCDLEGSKVPQPSFPEISLGRRIWRGVVMTLRMPYDLASNLVIGFDGSNSWQRLDKQHSKNYVAFFSDQVPVDQIKEIKNKYNTSYNVAAYAIAIGGIRRLMIEAGQKVPRIMSCFVPFPLPEHPGGLVVHVSGFYFSFSPRIESPIERIRQISKNTQILNDAPAVPIAYRYGFDLLSLLPVSMLKLIQQNLPTTLAITSFPGPENELETMGTAKLVDMIAALGHTGDQLGAVGVLVSIAGKQRFVITVDPDIFESYHVPVNFARHINDEVHDLLYSKD